MKYIKEYKEEKDFFEISHQEFSKIYNNSKISVSDLEFEQIKSGIINYLRKYEVENIDTMNFKLANYSDETLSFVFSESINDLRKNPGDRQRGLELLQIHKCDDEWWIISIATWRGYHFYKCDQIYGVLEAAPRLSLCLIHGLFKPSSFY